MTATGRRVAGNRWVRIGARLGLAARAVVWGLMGVLAIEIAVGGSARQADQQGALAAVAAHSGGRILLVLIAAGLAAYALWRFTLAAFGTSTVGSDVSTRLQDLVRAISYGVLCTSTVSVVTGSQGQSQDRQQQGVSAHLMSHTGGRWLLGAIGVVVIGVGAYYVWQGVRKDIYEHLDLRDVPAQLRTATAWVGVVGNVARGLVIALAGVLVVSAAVTADAKKSSGLDGALRSVAHQPYGPWLLGVAGLGLIAFGVFGVAEGVWSKV